VPTLVLPVGTRSGVARDDLVAEQREADGTFTQRDGAFAEYTRVVDESAGTDTIIYRLDIPYWGWLFGPLARRSLRERPAEPGRQPFWAPPERVDARTASALGVLAAITLAVGFLNTLFTQTITFAGDEFGSGDRARAAAGTAVRVAIVIALAFAVLADRRGRRTALLAAYTIAPITAALGAFAPNLTVLTLTQMASRPLALAMTVLTGVVAAEEMPKGARAWAIGILGMSTGLGAGLCVMALPLAGLGDRAWRLVYVLPLLFLFLRPGIARRLPESRRFEHVQETHHTGGLRRHGRRFWMVALTGLLTNVLVAPASFFQNQYLSDERGYSAGLISVFTLVTATPAGLGLLIGGRLADRHGRRLVGAFALAANAIGTVMAYRSEGWAMWMWSLSQGVLGAAALPAIGVYSAELFPTGGRSKAGMLITVLTLGGSSVGLLATGELLDAGWGFASIMPLLAIGPALVILAVLTLYPETARTELEDINPEDR
jgi:MFS family permease